MKRQEHDADLVRLYLEGKPLREIADLLRVTQQAISLRLTALRRYGVKLPLRHGRKAVDVAALNKLIEEHQK